MKIEQKQYLIKFSSLSAPTKIEELTAGSDEKPSAAPPGIEPRVWRILVTHSNRGGTVANRLRRRTSDQTVLGSNPAVPAALSPWTRLFTPIVPRRSLHISFY